MFSHLYIFFEGKRQGRWREGKKRERGKVSWGSGKKRGKKEKENKKTKNLERREKGRWREKNVILIQEPCTCPFSCPVPTTHTTHTKKKKEATHKTPNKKMKKGIWDG